MCGKIAFYLVDKRNLDDLMRITATAFGYGKVHRSVDFSCMSATRVSDGAQAGDTRRWLFLKGHSLRIIRRIRRITCIYRNLGTDDMAVRDWHNSRNMYTSLLITRDVAEDSPSSPNNP